MDLRRIPAMRGLGKWEFDIGDIIVKVGSNIKYRVASQWYGEYMLVIFQGESALGEPKSSVEAEYVKVGHVSEDDCDKEVEDDGKWQ